MNEKIYTYDVGDFYKPGLLIDCYYEYKTLKDILDLYYRCKPNCRSDMDDVVKFFSVKRDKVHRVYKLKEFERMVKLSVI
jgi:hypothetical protein